MTNGDSSRCASTKSAPFTTRRRHFVCMSVNVNNNVLLTFGSDTFPPQKGAVECLLFVVCTESSEYLDPLDMKLDEAKGKNQECLYCSVFSQVSIVKICLN